MAVSFTEKVISKGLFGLDFYVPNRILKFGSEYVFPFWELGLEHFIL